MTTENTVSFVEQIGTMQDKKDFKNLHWTGSMDDYISMVRERPEITRNAHQRLYDMVMSYGEEEFVDNKKKLTKYNFFADPMNDGADAIFGLHIPLMKLVSVLKAAAKGYGPDRRLILLHGPVSSAKSTIARLLKKGVERYSRTSDGALYTFEWVNLKATGLVKSDDEDTFLSPMHEEPLKLIPEEWREKVFSQLKLGNDKFKLRINGDLDPASRFIFKELLEKYEGDWTRVIKEHIGVKRLVLSEKDRMGIGTFQPKDEKNQDSTELTGDINYRRIAQYGSDSDPRAFSWKGEFLNSNRGLMEFVEVLKLDTAFLYDLLCATQEKLIKPKNFQQISIDEVIIGHTNEAEYNKLMKDDFMEALKDRTIKIDVPYVTRLTDEIRIYEKDFNSKKVPHIHIAPHTVQMAAEFSILSRLEDPKKYNLSLLQKMRLYDGKVITGYTQDTVKELRKEAIREGMDGISPRFIQDKISNALVNEGEQEGQINPFMVLNHLEKGLSGHSLIKSDEQRKRYIELVGLVKRDLEDVLKLEVQMAICADEGALEKLAANYIDQVKSFTLKEKIKNKYTGQAEEADEKLMRSVEEKIDIPDNRKEDFRREVMNFIGALSLEGKKFEWNTNDRLRRALELKLFEDSKHTIKLKSIVSSVVDKDTQEKLDIVRARLCRLYGYNERSANDVLEFVSSIFSRGEAQEK